MPDDNPLADRGRSLEADYFRKRDRELIEKMRQAAAVDEARREMSAKTGLQDTGLLQELQALGFTPETVPLLFFVPLVQMAWAEGGVSDAEKKMIVQLARARGIVEDGAADRQLAEWLSNKPDPKVVESATRLIRAMLDTSAPAAGGLSGDDLVKYCEDIAAASGGIFGLNRVSADERALLSTLANDLGRPRT